MSAFSPELNAASRVGDATGVGGVTTEDEADENDLLHKEFWVGALLEDPRASVTGNG